MATKQLNQITRGDQIATSQGIVRVASMITNWSEDFTGRNTKPVTITISGFLNGKTVYLTAPETASVLVCDPIEESK